jgi:hypothetical protein
MQRENGTMRIESPDSGTRARYRRVIHAAKQHGLVPGGHHLRHTGRDAGDIVIRLYTDAYPDETDWNRIRLNTRRVTTDPELAFSALEADPANLAVSPELLPRTLQLIRLLAGEADRRGHRLGVTRTAVDRVLAGVTRLRRSLGRRARARANGLTMYCRRPPVAPRSRPPYITRDHPARPRARRERRLVTHGAFRCTQTFTGEGRRLPSSRRLGHL